MKSKKLAALVLPGLLIAVLSTPALGAQVDVSVTNMTSGIYFTPIVVAAHDDATSIFSPGGTASASLELVAECGDTTDLVADLDSAGADTLVNPFGGPMGPGLTASGTLMTQAGNDYLSLAAMLLPTNDGFVGMSSLPIPSAAGTYSYLLYGFDAGTEANDELISSGCDASTPGIPADPSGLAGSNGSGVAGTDTNTMIHIHRGVLGDLNPSGGISDLSSSDHRWLNPVGRLTLTVH